MHKVIAIVLIVFLFYSPASYAQDAGQQIERTNATVPIAFKVLSSSYKFRDFTVPYKIAVWYPAAAASQGKYSYSIGPSKISADLAVDAPARAGKFPIIFYSHGATGAGTSSFFICEMLARNGYIVVAPDLLDLVSVARIEETIPYDNMMKMKAAQYIQSLREFGLNKVGKESRLLYRYRPEQMKQTMDLVLASNESADNVLHHHIDETKVGMMGHSFGAWTTLLLAGAEPSLHDRRIKAVAALSGPVNDLVFRVAKDNDLALVQVPVIFEYGELEPSAGRLDDKTLLFERANSPKALVCIENADHLSFSGGVKGEHRLSSEYIDKDAARRAISETTLDFFDAFLKGDAAKKNALSGKRAGVVSSFTAF